MSLISNFLKHTERKGTDPLIQYKLPPSSHTCRHGPLLVKKKIFLKLNPKFRSKKTIMPFNCRNPKGKIGDEEETIRPGERETDSEKGHPKICSIRFLQSATAVCFLCEEGRQLDLFPRREKTVCISFHMDLFFFCLLPDSGIERSFHIFDLMIPSSRLGFQSLTYSNSLSDGYLQEVTHLYVVCNMFFF